MAMSKIDEYANQAVPVREPAVHSALSDVVYEVGRLEELAGQLIGRLSPVLSPTLKGATGADCAKAPASCELSGRLSIQADKLRRIQAALGEALQALEI
jgi:hypothetical protein